MGKGNFEIGVESQNKSVIEKAKEMLNGIKQREGTSHILYTVEIVNGSRVLREYSIPDSLCMDISSSPCRCLIRKIYHETYVITLNNKECDIILDNYKKALISNINKEFWVLLGVEIEKFYLSTI